MDKIKVSIVIQSMLSDAMIEMEVVESLERLRFVKYLINYYPNTNQDIMLDFVYEQFKKLDDN